jgi:hypothetical protein
MDKWPFRESPKSAAITVRQIVDEAQWIHSVFHDADDGSWHFIGPDAPQEEDALVVSLEQMTTVDPSILSLADLPRGWCAWRDTPDTSWQRATHYPFLCSPLAVVDDESKEANAEEELWTAPQYSLSAVLGVVTVFALLFSFFVTLKIEWFKGLFGAAIIALIVWTLFNVRRMTKLSEHTRRESDARKQAGRCDTEDG